MAKKGSRMNVAIDVETTGLWAGKQEICEIAVVPLLPDLRPHPDFSPFVSGVRPERWDAIQLKALEVNGFTIAELEAFDVDATLVDARGVELPMPTAHDDFSEKAGAHFKLVSPEVFKNREKLQQVMTKHGFALFESEWWHFDDADWERYDALDVPLEQWEPAPQK